MTNLNLYRNMLLNYSEQETAAARSNALAILQQTGLSLGQLQDVVAVIVKTEDQKITQVS